MENLYKPCAMCGGLHNAAEDIVFDAEILTKGLRRIYDGFDVRYDIEKSIFDETLRLFNQAVAAGIAEAAHPYVTSDEFVSQLRQNNAVFSAFKTHRMQNDVARRLIDEDGNLKSFSRWVRDVKDITDHYYKDWLKTEYSTAVVRAHQAVDWKHYETERDVFPNLKWMPTTSIEQDPLHRQFWEKGLVLPIGHPFWEKHRPGDRWNCKCSLKQTDEAPNDEVLRDTEDVTAQPGLENHPAYDGRIFSKTHPYYTKAYPGAEDATQQLLKFD